MRYRLDATVRRLGGGRVVLGGSPLRLFRLSPRGAEVLERVASDQDLVPSGAEAVLLDRLVDTGVLHPRPTGGPFGADEVTVVVPVRDRVGGLGRLLDSLARCPTEERPGAVVVVDDGSLDPAAHAAVAARHGAELVRRDRSGGPGVARNEGLAAVRTPLAAVLDSDCTVGPGWLASLLGHFADERVAVVAARVRTRAGAGRLDRYEAARSPLDLGPAPGRVAPRTRVAYVPAAGLLTRVDAVRSVGGFDPSLRFGEDVDLVWRLVEHGWRVRYEPAAQVEHEVREHPVAWLGQRIGYGSSAAPLDARHPGAVAPVSCSAWSAAAWALAALGHPVLGLLVAGGSAAALPRKLDAVGTAEAVRLALAGHLGAGRLLAQAVTRAWWPALLPVAVVSRRVRRAAVLAAAARVVEARRASPSDLGPAAFAALVLADDAAYTVGVWRGCWQQRSMGALLPVLSSWPGRERSSDRPTRD